MRKPRPARRAKAAVSHRRGAMVVLMAILMVVLVAMVAFSVDLGYICRVQAELQNAADAAALAGAQQAMLASVASDDDTENLAQATIAAATAKAQEYAERHQAGGITLTLPVDDIVVGYQQSPGSDAVLPWSRGERVPNCVQVTTRRDDSANGSLALFFAPMLGTKSSNLAATAVAAFDTQRYRVTGFQSSPTGPHGKLLPIAIRLETWEGFMAGGTSPSGSRRDDYILTLTLPNSPEQAPDNVSMGSDDIPELRGTGNWSLEPNDFGLLQFDASANSYSTEDAAAWIRSGPSSSDLGGFGPNGIEATPDQPLQIPAGPPWGHSLVDDLNAVVGQPRIVPLYASRSGYAWQGRYSIVGFAGVSVVKADPLLWNRVRIVLQPTIVIDPTATVDADAESITQFVFPDRPLSLVK